jgi:hypothetical protein
MRRKLGCHAVWLGLSVTALLAASGCAAASGWVGQALMWDLRATPVAFLFGVLAGWVGKEA